MHKTRRQRWGRSVGALIVALGTSTAAAQPEIEGQWDGPFAWPFAVSHAALLADGTVLIWSDQGDTPQVWDPELDSFNVVAAPESLTSGSAALLLADGDVIVLGGAGDSDSASTSVWRYDATSGWSAEVPLVQGRRRASATLLGDARMLALSGRQFLSQPANLPEVAEPGGGWVSLVLAALSLPDRPWTFWTTNHEVLVAGPDQTTRSLDPNGGGDWDTISHHLLGGRTGGTAVLVPGTVDRALIIGGRDPATATCEVLDLPNTMAWQSTGSLHNARRHHNATLLADGSVLVSGGTLVGDDSTFSVLSAERYDNATETWSNLASMSVSRRLGSIALLLPDARVLVAGGGGGSAGSELHADAEIFSPPYLFGGPRPTITNAADSVVYGQTLVVTTPEADSVDAVWLVRAGSVHGSFNGDQRALALGFEVASGDLEVGLPDSLDVAPPGTYLLFLLNAGVPSVAHLLNLQEAPPAIPIPDITSTPPLSGSVGNVYAYSATADGPGPITWTLEEAPAWLGINAASGLVSGIPTAEQSFLVTLRATNAGGFDEQTWSITVTGTPRKVIPIGATWRYFKGTASPGSTWASVGHPDSTWLSGPSGFGYGDDDDATVLDDMQGNYSTVFTRHTFELYAPQSVSRFSILYDYDDGFAAYLNGQRILALNAPDSVLNTSLATANHEAAGTFTSQEITDLATLALFQTGDNVLAVVGLNRTLNNVDMTLRIELEITGGADFPTDAVERSTSRWTFEPVFPNPFVSAAHFRFGLQHAGAARLEIFDVRGRRVRTIRARHLVAGTHVLEWDGRSTRGQRVAPGVYFYRLQTPELEHRGKIVRSALR